MYLVTLFLRSAFFFLAFNVYHLFNCNSCYKLPHQGKFVGDRFKTSLLLVGEFSKYLNRVSSCSSFPGA